MLSGSMHHAAPQLRQSTANLLTDLCWFAATFHAPAPEPDGPPCRLRRGDQGHPGHGGLLRGTLAVLVNVRVSDFLRQQFGVVVLRDCPLTRYGEAVASPKARKLRIALVNIRRITGVSEWENKSV